MKRASKRGSLRRGKVAAKKIGVAKKSKRSSNPLIATKVARKISRASYIRKYVAAYQNLEAVKDRELNSVDRIFKRIASKGI